MAMKGSYYEIILKFRVKFKLIAVIWVLVLKDVNLLTQLRWL